MRPVFLNIFILPIHVQTTREPNAFENVWASKNNLLDEEVSAEITQNYNNELSV